jgi:hypothetical protein
MEALHVLLEDVEGVATSRHRRDEFTLRAFANAVNLSDSATLVLCRRASQTLRLP